MHSGNNVTNCMEQIPSGNWKFIAVFKEPLKPGVDLFFF
jgi:hypothetical protein